MRRVVLISLMMVAALAAFAVPLKPDLQKILKQGEQKQRRFEPAQAGWNGPEMTRAQQTAPNPVYETYGPTASAKAVRSALVAAATPDFKSIAAIGVLILLLRYTRHQRMQRVRAAVVPIRTGTTESDRRAA